MREEEIQNVPLPQVWIREDPLPWMQLNKESASTAAGFSPTSGPTTIRKTFKVKHHHIVLTIQDELKTTVFRPTTKLLKVLMDCAILAITQVTE